MTFAYTHHAAVSPIDGQVEVIARPLVKIVAVGPAATRDYWALVDTGADKTVIPKSVAVKLGIPLRPARSPVHGVAGDALSLEVGDVGFRLEQDGEVHAWTDAVLFGDFSDPTETILLGQHGFLEFFTATFDGEAVELTLVRNAVPFA